MPPLPEALTSTPGRAKVRRRRELGRKLPRTAIEGIAWEQACQHTRRLDGVSKQGHSRLIERIHAPTTWKMRWGLQSMEVQQRTIAAMEEGAARLQRDLNHRAVLCDDQSPCRVTLEHEKPNSWQRAPNLMICVGGNLSAVRVCDPWGERWQRNGGMYLDGWRFSKGRSCKSIEIEGLARWWRGLRSEPPFLNATSPWLGRHVAAKLLATQQTETAAYLAALPTLLSSADGLPSARQSLSHGTCAFVGSGHDLRCGAARGAEIDAHDAVFRANAAQQREAQDRWIDSARAGRRTDYRVNCLHESRAVPSMRDEVCILPLPWWLLPQGKEWVSNAARICCEDQARSSYDAETLVQHIKRGSRFAFVNAAASIKDLMPLSLDPGSFDAEPLLRTLFPQKRPHLTEREAYLGLTPHGSFLANSGGNALYAALAMCNHVDVYGVGLFSAGASGDKLYAHAYDDRVGKCAPPPGGRGLDALRMKPAPWDHRKQMINGLSYGPSWLRARIDRELLMHVFHAFDILRWVQ